MIDRFDFDQTQPLLLLIEFTVLSLLRIDGWLRPTMNDSRWTRLILWSGDYLSLIRSFTGWIFYSPRCSVGSRSSSLSIDPHYIRGELTKAECPMLALEELRENLYRIVVPLPDSPLKEINSYTLTSKDRNLVIDTGMNRPECREVLEQGLAEIGLDLGRTDFVATHLHADHQGLISTLMRAGSRAYMGAADTPAFRQGPADTWSRDGFMGSYGSRSGFPEKDLEASMQNHPGFKYSSGAGVDFVALEEGDRFDVGDYHLEVIHTPGHTAGHICLFERDQGILFSGDHVLGDITPNIATWSDDGDPLADYLASLRKVKPLEVALCLPGHRTPVADFQGRVEALIEHHRERADEVFDILTNGPGNAYDIAGQMTWSIRARCWEEFPVMQRWFATGEAIAHLRFLEGEGRVNRLDGDDEIVFSA